MLEKFIDLRSDTVTRPTPAMRAAMLAASVGDDVFGDDPTVNALQDSLAARLGFEAGLFCATGTQSNLVAIMAHCQRGDEYIVGQQAHTYRYEGGGAGVLGSVWPQPIANAPDGSLPLADIEAAIKPDDPHFARTRLLALENTIGGRVLLPAYLQQAVTHARRHGLATHLDGARFFNAVVASRGPGESLNACAHRLLQGFDSVSICLSKGLGAPVGSVLLGSRALIASGRRIRKMLGGGMRQAGFLAAAGLYALEHHIDRLAEDHTNAQALWQGLQGLDGLNVTEPQTNIVFAHVKSELADAFAAHLKAKHVGYTGLYALRWVTHLDVSRADVDEAVARIRSFEGFGGFGAA
jgi:threonine aldolase